MISYQYFYLKTWIVVLHSWNQYNIVCQLYFNNKNNSKKQKGPKFIWSITSTICIVGFALRHFPFLATDCLCICKERGEKKLGPQYPLEYKPPFWSNWANLGHIPNPRPKSATRKVTQPESQMSYLGWNDIWESVRLLTVVFWFRYGYWWKLQREQFLYSVFLIIVSHNDFNISFMN